MTFHAATEVMLFPPKNVELMFYSSSAVAEMGDRGHNRHRPKEGGCCAPFVESWDPI